MYACVMVDVSYIPLPVFHNNTPFLHCFFQMECIKEKGWPASAALLLCMLIRIARLDACFT